MTHKGRATLTALIAVFMLGALAAASASAWAASPEFVPQAGQTFPISIGNSLHTGTVTFSWPSMIWGKCSENKTEGTITGAKAVSLTLEWAGCSLGWHTEGSPEGHIVVTGTGSLRYISRAKEQVGVVLAIKEVKILSGGEYIKMRGSLVIPITPLNTETGKFTLPIHEKSLGEQEFGSYENESREVITARPEIEYGTSLKRAGIEVTGSNELTASKSVTIKTKTPPPPPLPAFALGEGITYPVALEGSAPTAKVALESAAGVLSCEGANTKGTISAGRTLSSLTYELQHCEEKGTTECQTTGAEAGHIVVTGSASLVYIDKAEELVGLVYNLNEAAVTCGTAIVKARGTLVIPITPIAIKTTHPILTLTRDGEAYENTYTTYENEKGEATTTKLELNFQTGYKKGLLETGELQLTSNKVLTVEG
jgi:hypothetical protein